MLGRLGRVAAVAAVAVAVGAGIAARAAFGVCVIDGASMRPVLQPADVVFTERHPASVRAGDIVVVPRPGWPSGVAHRVVSVCGPLLTLRGDANPVADRDPVRTDAVLGRVVARMPTGAFVGAVAGWSAR